MAERDSINNTGEMVEEGAHVRIEVWRTLVMSWGVLVLRVQDCPNYPALLVIPILERM